MKKIISGFLASLLFICVIAPLSWGASRSTKTTFGNTLLSRNIQLLTTTPTDLTTTNTEVFQVVFTNVTAGAVTVTIADKQATPRYLFNAKSIGANDTVVYNFPEGVTLSGGLTWSASANNSIQVSIKGWRI